MNDLRHDLAQACSWLLRNRWVAALAVLTIAVAVGPNTAVFSVVDAVVLRPLPFAEQERLLCLWSSSPEQRQQRLSVPDTRDLEGCRSFAATAVYLPGVYAVGTEQWSEDLATVSVSSGTLAAFGVAPVLGRDFQPADEEQDTEQVVMLGHQLWQRRFQGDPGVLGKTFTVRGVERTIVGVLPEGFGLLPIVGGKVEEFPVWLPIPRWAGWSEMRGLQMVYLVARLQPGVSVGTAQAEVAAVARRLQQQYPESNRDRRFRLVPITEQILGDLDRGLLLLLGAVGLVVLIAVSNVVNLLLALGIGRRREIATRLALGASRARIVRQLLLESLLLGLTGGGTGLLFAAWGLGLLQRMAPPGVPRLDEAGIDGRVVLFCIVVSVLTGLLLGLVPALQHCRLHLRTALDDRSLGIAAAGGSSSLSELLQVGQIALATVLLVGAGLMTRSLWSLLAVDPGFVVDRILAVRMRVPGDHPDPAVLYRQLQERIEALPGVRGFGTIGSLPFGHPGYEVRYGTGRDRGGRSSEETSLTTLFQQVSPGYFRAMQIPVREGRRFSWDDLGSDGVPVIVSETMAAEGWPDGSPLGNPITPDAKLRIGPMTVVGVVADVHHGSLAAAPRPTLYRPGTRTGNFAFYAVVRTGGDPGRLAAAVRAAMLEVEPRAAVLETTAMRDLVLASLVQPRFVHWLLGILSLLATVLAVVGIYGLMAYSTARRRSELAVRMSLGATAGSIARLQLRRGLRLAAAGVAIGSGAALALGRLLASLLYETSTGDVLSLLGAALLLLCTSLLACLVPALRAARTNPLEILRHE